MGGNHGKSAAQGHARNGSKRSPPHPLRISLRQTVEVPGQPDEINYFVHWSDGSEFWCRGSRLTELYPELVQRTEAQPTVPFLEVGPTHAVSQPPAPPRAIANELDPHPAHSSAAMGTGADQRAKPARVVSQPPAPRRAAANQGLRSRPDPQELGDGLTTDPKEIRDTGNKLMPHQLQGLNWLMKNWAARRNSILADEMGLGKTVQVIALVQYLFTEYGRCPALVVVPLSTVACAPIMCPAQTLWDFSEMLTLVGDICTRFGYAIITTCRFYRLRIVWDKGNSSNKAVNHLGVRKTGANASRSRSLADWFGVPRNAYLATTVALWALLIASSGAVTFLRIVEYIHRETRAKRIAVPIVDDARQIERTISGVAFSFAFFGNVAADYLFYSVVVRGIKGEVTSRDKVKALLPYLPVMIFQAMYLLLLVMAAIFTDRQYRYLITSYIILVLFLPTFEAFIFYMVSIPQTRSMVAKSRGGGSGYGSGYGSGSGGRSRSRSNGPAGISKASGTSPLDYYTSGNGEERNIPLPPPKPTMASAGTATTTTASGQMYSSNDTLNVQSGGQHAHQSQQRRSPSPGPSPVSPNGPAHSSSHPAWAGYPQPPKSPNPPSYRSHPSVDSGSVPRWQPPATPARQNSTELPMTPVHHHQYQQQQVPLRQGSFKHPSTVNNIGAPVRSSPPSSLQLAGQARIPSQQQSQQHSQYPTSPVEGEEPQWRAPRW